jgi:trk system potassium uptake protein TrkA
VKIVICGGGQVGYHLAKYLSEDANDVTLIDISPEVIRHVTETLDVQGILGSAAHPEILSMAGAEGAEMLIAVTQQDEINMVACQVAHTLFRTPTKIARIRDQNYLNPQWASLFAQEHMPVDFIISPEMEVAKSIERTLRIPGAFEAFNLAGGIAKAIGVRMKEGMPILRTPLKHLRTLFPELELVIIGIVRDDALILPTGESVILPGDIIYLIVPTADVHRSLQAFNFADQATQRVLILGSGGIGLRLAELLATSFNDVNVLIIEKDRDRANFVAKEASKAIVLHGDALDVEVLTEAGVDRVDTVISITNDDKVNVLSALLAKSLGAKRAISLVTEMAYSSLMFPLGIDALVSPQAITVASILQYVRRGRVKMVYAIQEGKGEIVDMEVVANSVLVGRELKEANFPKTAFVAALVRSEEVILQPKETLAIEVGDRILMMVAPEAIKYIEKAFSTRI